MGEEQTNTLLICCGAILDRNEYQVANKLQGQPLPSETISVNTPLPLSSGTALCVV